jgi:PTS hybrid protein
MTSQPVSTGTVGIVLVSHSAELAAGVAHLAAQVSGGTVTIIAAGGTDDDELGTSAAKVERGLRLAESGGGVVVLSDLGSAVLTVRAVLEDEDPAANVVMADAPFVEGAVAATVTAAAGGDIKAVAAAAEEARNARKL